MKKINTFDNIKITSVSELVHTVNYCSSADKEYIRKVNNISIKDKVYTINNKTIKKII